MRLCCVIMKLDSQVYRLSLSSDVSQIHNIFYVFKLHEHREMNRIDSNSHYQICMINENCHEYFVNSIVNFIKKNHKLFYLVKWEDYEEQNEDHEI